MCGIAGYRYMDGRLAKGDSDITSMLEKIDHRGPDESGFYNYGPVSIGNTRLSIIGLDNGHQPITNEDGSVVVVFNGEIYNYPTLKKDLQSKGHIFKTSTDTEVLVHLYEEEGIGFLNRLNGMFTLALLDKTNNKLFVARDRFGVKPLFWMQRNGRFSFASEMKSLKVLAEFDSDLSPEGLSCFLGLFYIPDPWTIFKNVRRLKPGHFLTITDKDIVESEYYDFDFTTKNKISSSEASEETSRLLRNAVSRQLLADVPVGVLLSGGLDSRSILSAASESNPDISAFTISFQEDAYNESHEAGSWAKLWGVNHHQMTFTEHQFAENYIQRQRDLDEPYAHWCNVAYSSFAQFIRDNGFKVVLSGSGGDELFLGYPTVNAAYFGRYYSKLPSWIKNNIFKKIISNLPAGQDRLPWAFKLKSFVNADHPDAIRQFFGFKEVVPYRLWNEWLTPEANQYLDQLDPVLAFNQYKNKISNMNFVDALSYLDLKVFLPGSGFYGTDSAYMSASVEARIPFMDNELVDFATQLPTNVRFHPFKLKKILNDALKSNFQHDRYGNEVAHNKYKKLGFDVPGNIWIQREPMHSLVNEILSEKRIKQTGVFRYDVVRQLLDEQLTGKQNNERVLQAMMSLVLFLDDAYDSI